MIKTTPADKWFSLCVRCRTNWTCEYKAMHFPDPSGRKGLHCSHFYGRGNWSTRFDPMNAFAHSYGSHQLLGSNAKLFAGWALEKMGKMEFDSLVCRSLDTKIGREYRKANKLKEGRTTALAAHFKREYEKMEEMRKDGITGRIEFSSYI